MTGSVLSTGDGHQGWQDKLSIMMVLELSICLKTGAMTLKTVLDKGYGSESARSWKLIADSFRLYAQRALPADGYLPPIVSNMPCTEILRFAQNDCEGGKAST